MRRAVRLGHPDFGKAFPCRCTAAESDEERAARLRRYSNLGSLSRLTFDNLSPQGRSPDHGHQLQFEQALDAARRFSREPAGWLLLTGPSGSGKTHLAAAIAGRRLDAGQGALFMVVPDLLDHLRAAYQPDSELGYDDLFELLKGAPVLVLDDLGVQSATPWAQEKVFQLINHRYNAQLPTVVTTNLDPGSFEPRLASRLSDPAITQVLYLERGGDGAGSELDALQSRRFRIGLGNGGVASDTEGQR